MRRSAVVNLAGSAVGLAVPTDAAYAASSAAVEAMTRVLACELRGRQITVNAVAPGLENPGDPAAIADIAAFLSSWRGQPRDALEQRQAELMERRE